MNPPRRLRPTAKQSGLALPIVLWVIALLTVIAGNFAYSMRGNAALTRNHIDAARARHLAEAGIRLAVFGLSHRDPAQRWRSDGYSRRLRLGDGNVSVRVRNEAGLININHANALQLRRLLRVLGVTPAAANRLAEAIEDWRDGDDLTRVNGAEGDDYVNAGKDYRPANRPFAAVAELQLVLGMSAELFHRVEPLVSVHGTSRVDPYSAPREVLLALPNYDDARIDQILVERASQDPRRTASGGVFRIHATATTGSGAAFSIRAVIRVFPGKNRKLRLAVLEWHESPREDLSLPRDEDPAPTAAASAS